MRESVFQRQVIQYLRSQGDYVFNVVGSPYQARGTADLLVCHKGLFVAIECKAEKGHESALQQRERRIVTAAGGIAEVAKDMAEVKAILRLAEYNERSR